MDNEMDKEIETMNKSFNEGISTEAPATSAPSTDAPATEVPATTTVTTDAPSTSAPTTSAPATELPVVDEKDKIIEDLRKKLAEKEVKTPATKAPATEAPFSLEDQDFLKDVDLDDLITDKDALNKLFNQVYKSAVSDTRKSLSESVLRQIPDIVKANIVIQQNLKATSDRFYEENKDLEPFKKVVAVVFEDLLAQNPDKKYDEILSLTAPEVRKRLDLQKKVVQQPNKSGTPRLPSSKGGGGGKRTDTKPDISPMEKELSDMSESLGR